MQRQILSASTLRYLMLGPLLGTILGVMLYPPVLSASNHNEVPIVSGQIGTAQPTDTFFFTAFEPMNNDRGLGITIADTGAGVEANFFLDDIDGTPNFVNLANIPVGDLNILPSQPSTASAFGVPGLGDVFAYAFATDGTLPQTMTVAVGMRNANGQSVFDTSIDNLPTFPDPSLNRPGIAVDNQGRATVVYSELDTGVAVVRARRFDANGNQIGNTLDIGAGIAAADVALLDPAGNRLIVPYSTFGTIRGRVIDTTGPTPVVLPDFPISTTPAQFANLATNVASDPTTGQSFVVWENISGVQGDPQNIFARRFDANGDPIGNDFRVNSSTANTQAQPSVTATPQQAFVVVWTTDDTGQTDDLDVKMQIYDDQNTPVPGGQDLTVATAVDIQDRPQVRTLPNSDPQDRPFVIGNWRAVERPVGTPVIGTGSSYRTFRIDGLDGEDPTPIFADGFESGDTTSWSSQQP